MIEMFKCEVLKDEHIYYDDNITHKTVSNFQHFSLCPLVLCSMTSLKQASTRQCHLCLRRRYVLTYCDFGQKLNTSPLYLTLNGLTDS